MFSCSETLEDCVLLRDRAEGTALCRMLLERRARGGMGGILRGDVGSGTSDGSA